MTLTLFALWSDSYSDSLNPLWRRSLGFAPVSLVDLNWHQTLTSLVVTAGERHFLQSMAMLTIAVGFCEYVHGTSAAIKVFFTSHLFVIVGLSLLVVLPAHYAGSDWGTALATQQDVGPSAGYYGCLGAGFASMKSGRRRLAMSVTLMILLVRLVNSVSQLPDLASIASADLSHLVALPLGFLLAGTKLLKQPGTNDETVGEIPPQ